MSVSTTPINTTDPLETGRVRINEHFADASQHSSNATVVDVEDYGVNIANTAAANKSALQSATGAHPEYVWHFGKGDYNLDNSGTGPAGCYINSQKGGFWFTGGSRLRFSANTKLGIVFNNCLKYFFVDGLSTIYATTPTAR